MAAPTYVAEYEAAWNTTTTPKTVSATAAAGDVFIVAAGSENGATTVSAPTGGTGITWTQQETQGAAGTVSHCRLFSATGLSAQSWTLSAASAGSSNWWGFDALRFSGSAGIGAHSSANNGTSAGTPTMSLTTTGANSAVVAICANWNGGTAEPTWGAINGYIPTVANGGTVAFFGNTSNYAIAVAIYPDVGAAGSKTISQSAPTGQRYVIAAIEVLGSAGGTPGTFTANAGDASADGGSTTLTGAAAFTANAGDAAADGASSTFTGAALFSANTGDAAAAGGSTSFTATAVFSATAGDAAADGGTGTFSAGGSPGTFTATAGDATADGGSASFTATAVFAATTGDASAGGGSAGFTGAALLTATAGDASADGGTATFTTAALFSATAGDAQASGGSSTFTGAALFTATAGDAAASGGTASFIGGSASTFTALAGDALAEGGSAAFTAPATFSALAGAAAAAGGTATFVVATSFVASTGDGTAGGGSSTFTGAAIFAATAGSAAAGGGTALFIAGEIPVTLERIGTHRELSSLGTSGSGHLGTHRETTS